ncbi:Methionine synthase [Phytophthora citrophthora]|uniref:Methionine synthase n=1 Tax=Phytophthora citrophthora TaxID=4793 RepID=A0AAD9LRN9_9STRA|nr:Methionine synthase [Phytophthora citrophthora]
MEAHLMTAPRRTSCVLLLDGGTGEELFARGLPDDRRTWSAAALVHEQHHTLLRDVHTSFLDAGSDFITCNNYGVTPGVGFSDKEIVQYTTVAGRIAREACDRWTSRSDRTKKPKVCGSLPPLLESYRPDKVPEVDEGVRLYTMIATALKPFVDCYLAETLSSIQEAKMALLGVQQAYCRETGGREGVMVSFTLNSCGRLRSGENVRDAAQDLLSFTENIFEMELQAILFNCSQPEAICKAFRELDADENIRERLHSRGVRLGAYANRLTAIPDAWALAESSQPQAMRTDVAVERYVDFVSQWIELGAEIVGGCCGVGPEYIASVKRVLHDQGK